MSPSPFLPYVRHKLDALSRLVVEDPGLLPEMLALRTAADDALRDAVHAHRGRGASWARIGRALGVSRQSAYQRFALIQRVRVDPAVRDEVFAADGYRCRRCGTTDDLTIDHIMPVSRGGTNERSNLQTLCRRCNCSKGARTEATA